MSKLMQWFGAIGASVAAVPAFATGGVDYTPIQSAVDFTSVATAIIAVFGLGAVAVLAWKGGGMVLSAIKKG